MSQDESRVAVEQVVMSTGAPVRVLRSEADTSGEDILSQLELSPFRYALLGIGGAGKMAEVPPRLRQLFNLGVSRTLDSSGALVLDGGTDVGLAALIGQSLADRNAPVDLIGLLPARKAGAPFDGGDADAAPLEPHHTHLVLTAGTEWGDETDTYFRLADALSRRAAMVGLLVNGGAIARQEVLRVVRRGWPLIVIQGSGRLADEIAAAHNAPPDDFDDDALAEIITHGDIHVLSLDQPVAPLRGAFQKLLTELVTRDATLKDAWSQFSLFDKNASEQQGRFLGLQKWILGLAVVATFLAILQTVLEQQALHLAALGAAGKAAPWALWSWFSDDPAALAASLSWLSETVLYYVIVAVPIVFTILVAGANRFKSGNKWLILRSAAEEIKSMIYQYRTGVGAFGAAELQKARQFPRQRLAERVAEITRRTMQSEANLSALIPYTGPIPPTMYGAAAEDDGLSPLSPEHYLAIRVGDQIGYFETKTVRIDRQMRRLQWTLYFLGGLGTLLAALGFELWIALTTAISGAIATFLEYQQLETNLTSYNQVKAELASIRRWWYSLSEGDRRNPDHFRLLVVNTEQLLGNERATWLQSMSDALAELREKQSSDDFLDMGGGPPLAPDGRVTAPETPEGN